MNWLGNITIKKKLYLLAFLSISMIIAIAGYGLFEQKNSSLSERKAKVKAQVEQVISLINFFYNQRHQLGETEAKQQAIEASRSLRYDDNNYFWITDQQLKVLMHPTKPALQNKDASGFTDGSGKYHWKEMAQISRTTGSGFLEYTWQSPKNQLLDKVSYVHYFSEWDWIIGSGLLVSDINDAFLTNIIHTSIAISLVTIFLVLASFVVGRNIVLPIEYLRYKVHHIAEGDVTTRFGVKRKDEIGDISNDMNGMLENLQSALKLASESANYSVDLVSDISSSSEQTAKEILEQHVQLDMLATAMDEMNSTTLEVSRNAEEAAERTTHVCSQANSSSKDMNETILRIRDTDEQMATVASLVDELNLGVESIANIVSVIQSISEQTNLLALNAAIEAARAGENGRGFAVVADEVRTLATNTNGSTEMIQQSISQLTEKVGKATSAVTVGRQKMQECVNSSEETQRELDNMVQTLNQASDMVTQIASAAEEQGLVSNEINQSVNVINHSANEVNVVAEQLAKHSQILVDNSIRLNTSLKYFTV
ncbi:methyl-accepting chemotaxis protein [Vibrio sp. HA2012]|uniref:methyl-accepting chemotaxis protein n=1 Tax=Vibrio sp. HA2012 TaxID=1971595 RepID=UPI000C2C5BC9|nr:methyl-accepting chemotaxis protein [Vibrio sp. HA2012]PJC87244.1 methyl-accepting chemotaxis protein [Vibrio sp. HA2012]